MGFSLAQGRGRDAVQPRMNVTPLVDVVLVLLIIFMVVTPLLAKQVPLALPKKDDAQADAPDDAAIVLTVTRDGALAVNGGAIPPEELEGRLARMLAARPDKVVFFDAADDAPYGSATLAIDVARRAGAKSVAILTDPVANEPPK